MFEKVDRKLKLAEYFLNNLRSLAKDAGGFAYIKLDKRNEMRANLDGFLFEVISAKDFFLQGINEHFRLSIPSKEVDEDRIMTCCSLPNYARDVVKKIKALLSDRNSWLWRLNNYRNSATHRELVRFAFEASGVLEVDKAQFKKIQRAASKGKLKTVLITEGNNLEYFAQTPRVDNVPVLAYLFKDPEDPSQGNTDVGVIQYCEQSLDKMRKLLENLYSELKIC